MKKNRIVIALIITAIVLCAALSVEAVPNPGAIVWNGSPRAFITSLYVGVLGRQPETQAVVTGWARQVNNTASSRYRVFWAFINSPEYKSSSWAKQRKEYHVYRKYYIKSDHYRYSVSKGPLGANYYHQAGPYTFGVAMALRGYYETFASRRRGSGQTGGVSGGRTFNNPRIGGYAVDHCLYWATQCNQPAADEFCRRNGFMRAKHFRWDFMAPTRVLATGQICNIPGRRGCGGFTQITCVGGRGGPAPPPQGGKGPGDPCHTREECRSGICLLGVCN